MQVFATHCSLFQAHAQRCKNAALTYDSKEEWRRFWTTGLIYCFIEKNAWKLMSAACCLSFFHVCCCWWGRWCVCCELPRTVRLNRVGVKKVNFFPNPVFKSLSICPSSKNDKSKHCHLSSLRKRSKLWSKGEKKEKKKCRWFLLQPFCTIQFVFPETQTDLIHHPVSQGGSVM